MCIISQCFRERVGAAIKARGLKVDVEAKENSIPGLVAAIEKFWK
jgi:hypothetical protein